MCSGKLMEAYFLAGITVILLCFASGKHTTTKPTNFGQQTTVKYYDQLQSLTNDDSLTITGKIQSPNKHTQFESKQREKITHKTGTNTDGIPSKGRKNMLYLYGKKQANISNNERQILSKTQNRDFSKNWFNQVDKEKETSDKIIHRKRRDEGKYGNDDDENIQTKDEDEEEDVQLIIIPRKPRKHLLPKNEGFDESDDEEDISETNDRISQTSIDDSEKNNQDSENLETNSKNFELDDSKNYQNSRNSEKDSEKPYKISKGSQNRIKNDFHGSKDLHLKSKDGNSNDDATLTLERVFSENDDDDSKNSHQSKSGADDYDLHLKVKDKSGTNVKLSGDLPGNIGSLIAVGEDGARVQIKNTRERARQKSSENTKTDVLQSVNVDATTDEIAKDLIKIKYGKLKHSPYPSNILLKPGGSVNKEIKIEADEENTNLTPLKSQGSDEKEANTKADKPTNQQPSNNIFSPMEFENGDDELMATSRLLDIAQKADDVSSLKETKDSSNTAKEPSKSLKDFTKDFAKGAAERQTSKAFLKSARVTPEVYKTQAEDIDKEASDNWYKLQSLEDRIVNEGSTAKTGKDVGSYNGTNPPMILPDQTIHGTARHHFEIHDLTDISGGKWKAVHIPDEDITSMLEVANHKKMSSDIQHEAPLYKDAQEAEIGGVKLPVEVHGRVSVFDHIPTMINKSKNSSTSPGKLIVAAENEHRGKEVRPLHVTHPSVIKLRGYTREEEPKNRELIHHKTSAKPSLVVAKIPDDDDGDDSEDLPLRRKLPTPIVAPLRKTRPIIRSGSMRSNILAGIIHQSAKSPTLEPSSNTTSSNPRMSQHPTTTQNGVAKSQHTNNDPSVLEKIKSLLLKSSSSPKTSVNTNAPSNKNSGSGKSVSSQKTQPSTENILPANHMPEKVPPASHVPTKVLSARPNNDGLFLPKTDAFSNHASALNRISSPKREALLLGIIKALLARDRLKIASAKPSATSGVASPLPQYSRQAVLQGLENLQMSKTVEQNDAGPSTPALGSRPGTENPALPGKNVDEVYQKERENEVKQELARANEEALEAKKMSHEESVMLANYDRFSNPESRSNWGNFAGPRQSQTPGGQVLSMLGTQQLNMLEETPNVP